MPNSLSNLCESDATNWVIELSPMTSLYWKAMIKINNYEYILEDMVFLVSILNLKIFARVLQCKTLQMQGVREAIRSINRAKITSEDS